MTRSVTSIARVAWPWLLGLAIIVAIATRVPLAAFRDAIHEGPHVRLLAVDAAVGIASLFADTFATWIGLLVMNVKWSLSRTLAVRGATYLLSLINYAVGQGGIGFYLHRDGMTGMRAAGVTLFSIGITFATLLAITVGAWLAGGYTGGTALTWTVVGSSIAFVIYLAIIAARPAALVRRELLAPLFDAGVGGHVLSVLARVPHVSLIVLGHWFALLAWNVPVPFEVAATALPIVVVAGVLPISPAGLGTIQAALVYFFSSYAPGPDSDARAAAILAFAIVHFVYTMVVQLAIGVACIAPARRGTPPAQP